MKRDIPLLCWWLSTITVSGEVWGRKGEKTKNVKKHLDKKRGIW